MSVRPHRRDGAELCRRREGATTTCPHTTPSDFVISPRKSTASPYSLHGGQAALRSGDCRGPRYGQNRGRCAWGARHSQKLECSNDPLPHFNLRLFSEVRLRLRRPVRFPRRSASASHRRRPDPARASAHDRAGGCDFGHSIGGLPDHPGRSPDRRLPFGGRTDRTGCGPGARHDAIARPGLRRIGGGRYRASGSDGQGESGGCGDAGLRTGPGRGLRNLDGRHRGSPLRTSSSPKSHL